MAYQDTQMKEQIRFLARPQDELRQVRGQDLYETLGNLGLSHRSITPAFEERKVN